MRKKSLLQDQILKKGIGLSLGGGACRGFFHIGVLRALEERKIKIAHISGVSVGALIGGLKAMGYCSNEILEHLTSYSYLKKLIPAISPTFFQDGFFSGKKIIKIINSFAKNKKIEELDIPFCCKAADLYNFQEIIFDQGDIGFAIKASCSIPGIFVSEKNNSHILVDGCMMGPVPMKIARSRFLGPILSVNLISYSKVDPGSALEISEFLKKTLLCKVFPSSNPVIRSYFLMQSQLASLEYELYPPDIAIHFTGTYFPNMSNIKKFRIQLVKEGYEATCSALDLHEL